MGKRMTLDRAIGLAIQAMENQRLGIYFRAMCYEKGGAQWAKAAWEKKKALEEAIEVLKGEVTNGKTNHI